MEVIDGLENIKALSYAVVTAGTFDGVHLGHQKILGRLREIADANQGQSVLITYWPHPRLVLNHSSHSKELRLLSSFEEKKQSLAHYGLDYLIVLPFTKEFAQLTSQEFVQQVLVDKIQTKKLVIGYDHRFGKNREGSFEHLQANAAQYGFEVEEIPRQDVEQEGVSSTLIRRAIEAGDVQTAAHYLGNFYPISGTVTRGQQIGRTIGFPTANIAITEPHKLIPANGVYAAKVHLQDGRCLNGMLNIGTRPTVNGLGQTIEVNIFDFAEDIYDQEISLELVARMRSEQRFENLAALQRQLYDDKEMARQMLG